MNPTRAYVGAQVRAVRSVEFFGFRVRPGAVGRVVEPIDAGNHGWAGKSWVEWEGDDASARCMNDFEIEVSTGLDLMLELL